MVTPENVFMDWSSGAVTIPSSFSQSPRVSVASLSRLCVCHSLNCKASTTHSDNIPEARCGIGSTAHPADLRALSSLEHKRFDSISSATMNVTGVPGNARIASMNPTGFDSCRSTSIASSFRLARFASAADCSALTARSFAAAISRLASRSFWRAFYAINTPIITSAKTPMVTIAPPITPRAGQLWCESASDSSWPDSTTKPETTVKPAKVRPTSSHPSSIMCLLIGPFIGRRGRNSSKSVPMWIVGLLVLSWVCLTWFLLVITR